MTRILLVDDDDAFRNLLGVQLSKMGYSVSEAGDGQQALALQAADAADLIITDLIMPEKEGLEIIQELRHRHSKVKIIAMSGGGRVRAADYLKVARLMGADRTLEKPFSLEALASAISEVLAEA